MVDVVSPATRSRMMAGIQGKNTRPEIMLRKGLHAQGFRFRLHDRALPGRPDMVFPRWNAVLFAHGCFWHGHDCHLFKWPSTREEFWRTKIGRNRAVDDETMKALEAQEWRRGVVWECAIKGRTRLPFDSILRTLTDWLQSSVPNLEIKGFE